MIDYEPHNWFEHLFDLKGSMIREVSLRVFACVGWAVLVIDLHHRGYLTMEVVPGTAHTLVGVALGLLLVFRTNSSYDRFWEGRRQWGSIVNESRNLARASRVYFGESDPTRFAEIVRWTIAFSYSCMYSLRHQTGLGSIAQQLPQEEVEAVLASRHVPLAIAGRITSRLVEARDQGLVSDYVMIDLDQNVQLLIDYLGACERIHKTPMPFAYAVHLRRSLILYCVTLPFALVQDYGWWAIVAVVMITYTFFGIEEIGVEIEDPFGSDPNDLPLERICETIENNLLGLIASVELPPVAEPRSLLAP